MSLATELATDPIARGYSGMTDAQAADNLTTVADRPWLRTLDAGDLNAWAAGAARYRKLEKAMEGVAPVGVTDETRSIARAAWRMVDRDSSQFEPNNAEQEGLVDALVAAGVLTAGDKTALWTRATELVTRAEELRLLNVRLPSPVRVGDVIMARAG